MNHANEGLSTFKYNNLHFFFLYYFTYFREVGLKYGNIFVRFFGSNEDIKSHSEID